jgi:hypothetical protein
MSLGLPLLMSLNDVAEGRDPIWLHSVLRTRLRHLQSPQRKTICPTFAEGLRKGLQSIGYSLYWFPDDLVGEHAPKQVGKISAIAAPERSSR